MRGEYIVGCMGTFYVVGTPIGNLEDLTLRAARALGEVSLVAAEDTRVSRRLLAHLGIRVSCVSCNEHNWRQRVPELVQALETGDVALITDAGMPGGQRPRGRRRGRRGRGGNFGAGDPGALGGYHGPGGVGLSR